jgi:hypothetical protein
MKDNMDNKNSSTPVDRVRLAVTLMIGIPFVILSLAAPFYPAALTVLKEIIVPLLALVVGYLFGQHSSHPRS